MPGESARRQLHVKGIVQGVGFRPFVYTLAHRHRLTGFITNTFQGVTIEIEGPPKALDAFVGALKHQAPPLAVITDIQSRAMEPAADPTFRINLSRPGLTMETMIAPDAAICRDCLAELLDPADRRCHYPFINCTNCGPRYTITANIPYDRPMTAMRHFTMCPACQAEYDDPANRRFHAQPNCCPVCGPQVMLFSPDRTKLATTDRALAKARSFLEQGAVVAIKGLGGFHLAVDAESDAAVCRLRQRKGRQEKPFAVMAADLETARSICILQKAEENQLGAPQSPIVLAPVKQGHTLSQHIAPANDLFGIMLPYTPLHHLLFQGSRYNALVMTSGNYSDEPLCIDNDEAFKRLSSIADYFLIHDRDIYCRNDDSIVIYSAGQMRPVRRSRGSVPQPIMVAHNGPPVLGVGAELKNTVCLLKQDQALVSQHIGDLKNLEAYTFFQRTIDHLQRIFAIRPELIVHDLHPAYLSSTWAQDQTGAERLAVQHHHAHLAACLAENRMDGPAIGLIMDGAGYGNDGTIWGGEVLIGDLGGFKRYACFEPMPLPGGDAAVKAPWRTAVAYLFQAFDGLVPDLPFLQGHDPGPILEMLSKGINSPLTSSCGRLFDAVAAMSGGIQTINYEAQAAIAFMQAGRRMAGKCFSFAIEDGDGMLTMSVRTIVRSVVKALRQGEPLALISQRFHRTLIELLKTVAIRAGLETGIRTVALSGGVFQNQLLFAGLIPALQEAGLTVITHTRLPVNDACISFGQAMIGRHHLLNQ